jgi:diguanylate cyclase (GGDEF)-like protein/PAS domain S-box-containing protein
VTVSLSDPDRLRALSQTELMDAGRQASLDRVTRMASRFLRAPIALVSLVDAQRQFFASEVGLGLQETPLSHSFCQRVVLDGAPVVVPDARLDPRFVDNPAIDDLGVIAYAGVPLRTAGGHTLGSLCVIQSTPRVWSDDEIELLRDLAESVLAEIELRTTNRALRESEAQLTAIIEHTPATIALQGTDGRYLRVNANVAAALGRKTDEILGLTTADLYPREVAEALGDDAHVLECATPVTTEVELTHADGSAHVYDVMRYAVRDAHGRVTGLGSFGLDVTDRRRAQQARELALAGLGAAQRLARVGSWSRDARDAGGEWSEEMFRIYDRDPGLGPASREEFLGYVVAEDRPGIAAAYAAMLAGESVLDLDCRIRTAAGVERVIHARAAADRDRAGVFAGTVQDVTELRRVERAVRDQGELLARVFDEAPIGMALVDPDGSFLRVNQALCEISGYTGHELTSLSFHAFTHPDDVDEERASLAQLLGGQIRAYQVDRRYMHRSGEVRWVRLSVSLVRDAQDAALHFIAQIQDITEQAKRDAEERALGRIAELVATNAGAAAVFGAVASEVQQLFGAHAGFVSRFDSDAGVGTVLSGLRADGQPMEQITFHRDDHSASAIVAKTGSPARVLTAAESHVDPTSDWLLQNRIASGVAAPVVVAGRLWGTLSVAFGGVDAPADTEARLTRFARLVAMAIANTSAWDLLSLQASTDALTGLANRRAFQIRLGTEVARASRYGRDLSLVLLDLDHFKAVNDAHGHQVGDQVLAEVGRRLLREARAGDLVARVGGEEFAWLLPETDSAAAGMAAERLRQSCAAEAFAGVGRLTLSAGICANAPGREPDDLVRLADRALYQAKDSGRNTTVMYAEAAPTPT